MQISIYVHTCSHLMSNESEYEQLQTVIRACIIFKEAEKNIHTYKERSKNNNKQKETSNLYIRNL